MRAAPESGLVRLVHIFLECFQSALDSLRQRMALRDTEPSRSPLAAISAPSQVPLGTPFGVSAE
eukprot:6529279-Pyramimonas_sp.AAC.1